MATAISTRHISVASSTPTNRNSGRNSQLNPIASQRTNVNQDRTSTLAAEGVPVKFAHSTFSFLIKDQISQLLNLPRIKRLHYTEENAARAVTYEITEILKQVIAQHTKDNYKVVTQVMAYPKQDEKNIIIMSRCLWNYRTDDVLSLETETDAFKFLIVIHGVAA